jgi:uncharacterized protein YcbK (DUF882 family)
VFAVVAGFGVVGSYPNEQTVHMNYGEWNQYPTSDPIIAQLPSLT